MAQNKEIWDPKGYNNSNGAQVRDARETIDLILQDGCKKAKIIVDIGCGSGNVTKMLSTLVPHDKIYAVDFDHTMIEYANNNYNDGTIEYFQQNVDLPWEKMDERLRNLEGKVDIVWSNRVLHWVKDKQTVAKTIGRLLKPGGRCFVNTTLTRSFNQFASEEQKRENLKYIKDESEKEQMDNWTKHFNNCGLSKVSIQMIPKEWEYDTVEQFHQLESSAVTSYVTRDMREDVPESEKETVLKKYIEMSLKVFQTKHNEDFENTEQHNMRNTYYEQCRIVGTK